MVTSTTLHPLDINLAKAPSNRVCYIILPDGVKDDIDVYLNDAAHRFNCSMVVIYGLNWNDDLTPWPAEGVFKEKKPFGGKASEFLDKFLSKEIIEIETQLELTNPDRFLVGLSLSGLFAVWTLTQTDLFHGAASISGSFWFDGFTEWVRVNPVKRMPIRIYISLGNREKNSRDKRMSRVQECTEELVSILERQGHSVDYRLVDGTHFSPIVPRLDMALESLLSH